MIKWKPTFPGTFINVVPSSLVHGMSHCTGRHVPHEWLTL